LVKEEGIPYFSAEKTPQTGSFLGGFQQMISTRVPKIDLKLKKAFALLTSVIEKECDKARISFR